MPLKPKQVKMLTGVGLAILTLLTRIPFRARTLFEFDSIDFAVATFRFNLEQVTPHMPGYIGHVLLGRFFSLFTSNINLAFVALSITLSVASVLLMWRAGAELRGERVGLIAAVLWLFTPLFWFYGEVATAYIHEAFFATAVLYLCLRLQNYPQEMRTLLLMGVALSLAGSMRQNSMLFFLPAIAYICYATRQPLRRIALALLFFAAFTAGWLLILFDESGGAAVYFDHLSRESIFRSQSILFGNPLAVHLAVAGKMLFYLTASGVAVILLACYALLRHGSELRAFAIAHYRSRKALTVMLVALPALLFYLLIYFMKAGYLLSILPSIVLCAAVLLDQLAIWNARRIKLASSDSLTLTRPLITKSAIVLTSVVVIVNVFLFLAPLPGKEYHYFAASVSQASFGNDLSDRVAEGTPTTRLLNRAYAYTSWQGIANVDRINVRIMQVLNENGAFDTNTQLLDTWWSRWQYYYNPQATTIDLITYPDSLAVGVSTQYVRSNDYSDTLKLPNATTRLLLIHPEHPDLPMLRATAGLEALDETLGIYRITAKGVGIQWRNKIVILQ